MKNTLLTLAFLLTLTSSASAQDKSRCAGDGPYPADCPPPSAIKQSPPPAAMTLAEPGEVTLAAAAASQVQHVGESNDVFEQPNDARYVRDVQPGALDTGCTYRAGSPFRIKLPVTRVVSRTGDTVPQALTDNGTIPSMVKLRLPVFDVDVNGRPGAPPEVDKVFFNNIYVGNLTGGDNFWKRNDFDVPISAVKFATYNGPGQDPTPGENIIEIQIDTLNGGWCTAVDWVELSVKVPSPIIFIHGNGSNGGFIERRGFARGLDAQGLLYDNSISQNPPANSVAANANNLKDRIPAIVQGFGVDSVHFLVHSKGGLDSRMYLGTYQPRFEDRFKVLSFTSLSSPHDGSPGADLIIGRRDAIMAQAAEVRFDRNFPTFTQTIAERMAADAGQENLTTQWVEAFGRWNVPSLQQVETVFNTVGADADTNGDGRINRDPDEYADLRAESPELTQLDDTAVVGHQVSRVGVNAIYQFMRGFSRVNLVWETRRDGTRVAHLLGVRAPNQPVANDVLVQAPSAHGEGSIGGRVRNRFTFTQANGGGRNHSNVADQGVARTVIPWILGVERERGDLK